MREGKAIALCGNEFAGFAILSHGKQTIWPANGLIVVEKIPWSRAS